jgi:neutral ceramidase
MKPVLLLALALVLASYSLAAEPKASVFRAGAATSNITPALGGEIIGGFNPFPSQHVHDELHARCLVLDNGETRLAFVVVDLVGADRLVYDEARRLVTAETGLPGECLIMSATHTHSATSALGKERFAPQTELDDYQKFVARRIADGVRRAINNLAPAQIGWAMANEPREVFNRRWFLKPGTMPVNPFGETNDLVKMNPGRASPNLDKPAGPTDPEICLIAVRTPGGRPIGVLANYSLHYVGGVRNADISADYFALFADRLQQLLGADRQEPPFVAIMSNGTSGNINNIDFSKPAGKHAPYEKMREVADRVATAAHGAYQKIQWRDNVPLAAKLELLEVGVRHPTPAQLARAKAILAGPADAKKTATLEYHYADRTVKMSAWPATIQIPIHALRVGDVAVGGIPNEVFVEIGLEYKRRSPFKPSFIMSIANGYYGYLPTPEHHKLGGYETWLGTNRLEVEASNKILAKLLALVGGLK